MRKYQFVGETNNYPTQISHMSQSGSEFRPPTFLAISGLLHLIPNVPSAVYPPHWCWSDLSEARLWSCYLCWKTLRLLIAYGWCSSSGSGPLAGEKRGGEKTHLAAAGDDVTIPNHEFLAEDEAVMEDVNCACLALCPLRLFCLGCLFFQNSRGTGTHRAQGLSFLWNLSWQAPHPLTICFFLSSLSLQIQAVVER